METKQFGKALEAFKESVKISQDKGWDPERFPWKNASDRIKQLEK